MVGETVTIVHRDGTEKAVQVEGWDTNDRPIVRLRLGLAGVYTAHLNHGYLEQKAGDWKLCAVDLDRLRAWADLRKRNWSEQQRPAPRRRAAARH